MGVGKKSGSREGGEVTVEKGGEKMRMDGMKFAYQILSGFLATEFLQREGERDEIWLWRRGT